MSAVNKEHCKGCRNDFYNTDGAAIACGGECWSFKSATLVRKRKVPATMAPPYDRVQIQLYPACYMAPGFVLFDPEPGE